MGLVTGEKSGPYEIVSPLGTGGWEKLSRFAGVSPSLSF